MKDDREESKRALQRMRDAIARVHRHVKGFDSVRFIRDEKTSDAVLMLLAAIGEEVQRIDPAILDRHPYPWHLVRAQRNVIAHDYFGIRLPSIWANIQQDLGPLDDLLRRILETEFP
ncbi:MAG: DUF86 domain-containing protein [Bacteroidetes bacterium]|nr:DUF86 domain-containing protein [Bacteroidota bacterium]